MPIKSPPVLARRTFSCTFSRYMTTGQSDDLPAEHLRGMLVLKRSELTRRRKQRLLCSRTPTRRFNTRNRFRGSLPLGVVACRLGLKKPLLLVETLAAAATSPLLLRFNLQGSHNLFILGPVLDCFSGVVSQDGCVERGVKAPQLLERGVVALFNQQE